MRLWKTFAAALGLLALVGTAQAGPVSGQGTWETTLHARDINGHAVALNSASAAFFYDSTLNVTWLADMNQNGPMTWGNAMAWADALTIGGFNDWRLPTMVDTGAAGCDFAYSGTDCGYNVQTKDGSTVYSEMAHLFYVTLGNLAYCGASLNCPQSGWGLTNTAFFQNMQADAYWTGTELWVGGVDAWYFDAGTQNFFNMYGHDLYAMAVRPGDVLRDAGNAVPEPQALVLALTALAGLGVAVRRRRAVASH